MDGMTFGIEPTSDGKFRLVEHYRNGFFVVGTYPDRESAERRKAASKSAPGPESIGREA